MGLFRSNKKNRFVEDVPGETAEERLQYYVQQSQEPAPEEKPRGKKDKPRREPPTPALRNKRRDDADADLGELEPALASEPQPGRGKLIDPQYQPLARTPPPQKESAVYDLELRDPGDSHPAPRSMLDKLFGVSESGWVQLGLIAIVVGAVIQASGVNPFARGFDWGAAPLALWDGAITTISWAFGNGWRPFLIGVAVVLPLWVIWRLLTIPFRH